MTKTEREIELEKQLAGGLEREKIHLNRAFRAEKKLDIAVKALNTIKQAIEFGFPKRGINIDTPYTMLLRSVEKKAQEALAKIKEIK